MSHKNQTTMQAVITAILQRHGYAGAFAQSADFHLKVENGPYLPLVIEKHGAEVSVAHYFTQNGDAMRDPEMTFLLPEWSPTSITQDPVGRYANVDEYDPGSLQRARLIAELSGFANAWARNIEAQGFVDGAHIVASSLTHPVGDASEEGLPDPAEDAHLEAEYESRFEQEDYEPSPYDGTYSED
jgi:hypothetical protein